MIIADHKSLKTLNTFGVDVEARHFVAIENKNDLSILFSDRTELVRPVLVLGGGSNMLFTKNYEGTVLKMNIKGIDVDEQNDRVYVTAGAGILWNDLVVFCVDRGYAGIENLSLIPGSVGAAPIQNIGAYGVELKDVFHSLEAFDTQKGGFQTFSKQQCGFGYRDSIFKGEHKGRYIIVSVCLVLSTKPKVNTGYGAIEEELKKRGIQNPSIKELSEVVSHIRVSKLPDPSTIGNAGSFFKNPVVDALVFERLGKKFPDVVGFPLPNGKVKLAAGWLIEQCGWKGKVVGNTGTWKNQALVLVNHGKATGQEVYDFSETIIQSVYGKFGIQLDREVNIIG